MGVGSSEERCSSQQFACLKFCTKLDPSLHRQATPLKVLMIVEKQLKIAIWGW